MSIDSFKDYIERQVRRHQGVNAEIIQFLPELLELQNYILQVEDLEKENRVLLLKSLGFLTLSADSMPRSFRNKDGLLAKAWLGASVLKNLIDRTERLQSFEDNWTGDISLLQGLETIIETGGRNLGEDLCRDILQFTQIERDLVTSRDPSGVTT